jgi:hypothetical protein
VQRKEEITDSCFECVGPIVNRVLFDIIRSLPPDRRAEAQAALSVHGITFTAETVTAAAAGRSSR